MELTKEQAQKLKEFLAVNEGMVELGDYSIILNFIDTHTMAGVEFNLGGEQTDDVKEVYAYMMRKGLTKLDDLKGSGKIKNKQ